MLARAALLRPRALAAMLDAYAPGGPPPEAPEFVRRMVAAAADWDAEEAAAERAGPRRATPPRSRSLAFSTTRVLYVETPSTEPPAGRCVDSL